MNGTVETQYGIFRLKPRDTNKATLLALKFLAWFFSHRWNKCLIHNTDKKILKVLPYPLDCADHHHHLNGQHLHSILHFPLLYLQLLFCLFPACCEQPEGEDLGLGILSNGASKFWGIKLLLYQQSFSANLPFLKKGSRLMQDHHAVCTCACKHMFHSNYRNDRFSQNLVRNK